MYMTKQSLPLALLAMALLTAAAMAKESYRQKGTLSDMQSVQCGSTQKSGSTVAGVLITGAQHSKTTDLLCQEYTLKTDRVTYRIRPKEEKHPVLLPVGEQAEFRLKKDKLILRIPELDNKDRAYQVLSMTATPELASTIEQSKHPPKAHRQQLSVESPAGSGDEGAGEAPAGADASGSAVAGGTATATSNPPPPAAAPRNGFVQVQSTPTGAQVFVDSALAGRTPSTLKLAPGTHTVQVVLTGYKDFVANIDVLAGAQQQLTATLSH